MKANYFAAAAVALLSGSVYAQASSVTLYGIADMGVEYISNATKTDKGLVRLQSGNLSGSRFGLRVKEDLGNGVKALATFEAGMNLASGQSAQNGRLFGRQAFVGISSDAGALTLGRQYSSIYDIMGRYDPMDYANYSVLAHDVGLMARADKSIKYTGVFKDVTLTGFYSFGRDSTDANLAGGNPLDRKAGRQWGLGFNYGIGPFSVGLAYDVVNLLTVSDLGNNLITNYLQAGTVITGNSDNSAKRIALGASYEIGSVKLLLGYRNLKSEYTVTNTVMSLKSDMTYKSNLYWGGAKWQATPEMSLTGAIHYSQNKNLPNVVSYVVGSSYSFSKRTDVYTNLSYMDNRQQGLSGSGWGVNAEDTTLPGKNQFGVQVGLRHRF